MGSKQKYLTYGRLGPRLGAGHEDAQESHHYQMDFIQGTALILLGDILQTKAEARGSPLLYVTDTLPTRFPEATQPESFLGEQRQTDLVSPRKYPEPSILRKPQ